ncbi:MAG: type II toxin-antitoxin system RelE/ParE family toxin [Deltaproteobacteria bacterium]|mgnify:CR=1 FL=1
MKALKYHVLWSNEAKKMLRSIPDKRIQAKIIERGEELAVDPEKQGKALVDDLSDFRSVRTVGQRYRILYKIENEKVIVFIIAVGIRKEGSKSDIYNLAKKLLRLGLVK